MDVSVENCMIETVVNVVVEAQSEFDYANNEINETPLGTCPALLLLVVAHPFELFDSLLWLGRVRATI